MLTHVYFHPSDLFPYRPLSFGWMLTCVSLSFIVYYLCGRKIALNDGQQHDASSTWLQRNTLLSFIHALVSSVLLIIAVLRAPEMFDDPLSHSNHFNYALIGLSVGYFIYDLVDCLRNSTTSMPAILAHHVVVITFFAHILLYTRNLGYGLHALSLEMNSVFLHGRRLLRWYPHVLPTTSAWRHRVKRFVDIGNYVTFVVCRFGIIVVGLRALHVQRSRLDPVVHAFTVAITSSIGLLNVVLFYRLVKNQLGRRTEDRMTSSLDKR